MTHRAVPRVCFWFPASKISPTWEGRWRDVAEAHENLLAPGARVLPSSVTLRAVGVNVPAD